MLLAGALTCAAHARAQPGPTGTGLSPPAHCSDFFQAGAQPVSIAPAASGAARTICHSFYAVSYSTELRDPLWSAEHLTREMAVGGDSIGRIKVKFVSDNAIDSADQASNKDFVAPFDRGHMTPANDAPDEATQRDTFVLTNAVPQHKKLNEHLWFYLEASLHQVAENEGDVYIVTGPIFGPTTHHRRVARPKATFKAIYIPTRNLAVGYIATNTAAPACRIFPVAELIRQSGIDPFPALSADLKASHSSYGLPQGINVKHNGAKQRLPLPDCH